MMFDYLTVEEVASKWQVSTQHVQGLCRKEVIPGAIKKGAMWFIPNDAEYPNIQANNSLKYQGTKSKIFEKAIQLFSEHSYEVVTLKDITDEVGIAQSAIYRHFKSKQDLLNAAYEYFVHHHIADRPSLEQFDSAIANDSLADLFNCCAYNYHEEHKELMISCIRIIFQRMTIDMRASEIFQKYILEVGLDYANQFFQKVVAAGRLPQGNTAVLSMYYNMSRMFTLLNLLTHADNSLKMEMERCQQDLTELIIRGISNTDHK